MIPLWFCDSGVFHDLKTTWDPPATVIHKHIGDVFHKASAQFFLKYLLWEYNWLLGQLLVGFYVGQFTLSGDIVHQQSWSLADGFNKVDTSLVIVWQSHKGYWAGNIFIEGVGVWSLHRLMSASCSTLPTLVPRLQTDFSCISCRKYCTPFHEIFCDNRYCVIDHKC